MFRIARTKRGEKMTPENNMNKTSELALAENNLNLLTKYTWLGNNTIADRDSNSNRWDLANFPPSFSRYNLKEVSCLKN